MTQDDIIRMAEEAGIESAFNLEKNQYVYRFGHGSVERFANLIATAERDRIATLVEDTFDFCGDEILVAEAIRARGNK